MVLDAYSQLLKLHDMCVLSGAFVGIKKIFMFVLYASSIHIKYTLPICHIPTLTYIGPEKNDAKSVINCADTSSTLKYQYKANVNIVLWQNFSNVQVSTTFHANFLAREGF